jgi:hypothetical protein
MRRGTWKTTVEAVIYVTFEMMKGKKPKCYDITEVYRAPSDPGIYAWYIYIPSNDDQISYHRILKKRSLSIRAKGYLKEKYEGNMELKSVISEEAGESNFLEKVTKFFCPPIYIGIAEEQDLDERLEQHRKGINEVVLNGERDDKNEFADRIGKKIRKTEGVSINSLYAKAYPVKNNQRIKELKSIEFFLNRTYVPFYGKK